MFVNLTLHKFLPAGANLKKLRKRMLHPVGNKLITFCIILYFLLY